MPAKIKKNPVAIVAVRLIEISKSDGWVWLLLKAKLQNQRLLEFHVEVNRLDELQFQVSIDPIGYLNLLSKNKRQVPCSDARN